VTPNHRKTPFDDPRVRRALTLAIDRWRGAPALSTIAIVHTVGSLVFPGSPLAPTREELEEIAGFWPDIEKSRAEARRLLKEAGADGLSFELLNSNVDQPYKYVATWLIDEWSKIGLHVTQRVIPTGPWVEAMRKDRSACPTTISRRQQPHSADGTLSLDLGRQNPDPSARRHGAAGAYSPRGFLLRGFSDACLHAAPRAVTGRHPKTLNVSRPSDRRDLTGEFGPKPTLRRSGQHLSSP